MTKAFALPTLRCMATKSVSASVASNVRAELARRGLTQRELADKLGLTQTAISSRLRGIVAFDVDELAVVAETLGVRIESLMTGVES